MNTPEITRPDTAVIASELVRTLPRQRFFADKAARLEQVEIALQEPLLPATDDHPAVDLLFVRAHLGSATPAYQLPIAWTDRVPSCGEHSVLVDVDGVVGYDALADAATITALGAVLADTEKLGPMTLHRVPGVETIPQPSVGRPMGAEQSNTSVVFDEHLMCKFFRRLHPGTNADVELLAALSEAGCTSVPRLFGWTELAVDGEVFTTAMVQEFVPNSAEGWAMALTSVRDIIREGDLQPADLGTDFASEARALGAAVASVHETLAASVPVSKKLTGEELVAPMLARLDHIAGVVPQVAERADEVRKLYRAAADTVSITGVPAQRIHGDLHLGQVLRTPREWLLIDFEGEPSRPWDERRLPDHPLRDVAGMARSFDYAAHYPLLSGRDNSRQHQYRVKEWAERNVDAFLTGYAERSGVDPRSNDALLTAFIVDKAIYECLYEAQNRPEWLQLPLGAVQRLLHD